MYPYTDEFTVEDEAGPLYDGSQTIPFRGRRPVPLPVLTSRFHIRKRLVKLKDNTCDCCGNSVWLNQPIMLEMDHINGNPEDHQLDNLRLLCPNCHAQTSTWRGRNKKTVDKKSKT